MHRFFALLVCLFSVSALAQEAPLEPEIFEVVEEKPELIGGLDDLQRRVVYPEMARRAGIEGKVFVQFVVDEKGFVTEAYAVRCPHELLCEAGIQAVQESRFTPGRHEGVPVKVRFTLPIDFKLRDTEEDGTADVLTVGYLSELLGHPWDRSSADRAIGGPVFGRIKNGTGTLLYEERSVPEIEEVLLTVRDGRAQTLEVRFTGMKTELESDIARFTERYGAPDDGWFSLHATGEARRIQLFPDQNRVVVEYSPLAGEAPIQRSEVPRAVPPPPPPPPAADDAGEIFEVAETMPEIVGGLEALQRRVVYPPEAREAGIEGRAFVQLVVERDGSVSEAFCTRGHPDLCRAALSAVRASTFTPGQQRGRPVRVQFILPVDFRLR